MIIIALLILILTVILLYCRLNLKKTKGEVSVDKKNKRLKTFFKREKTRDSLFDVKISAFELVLVHLIFAAIGFVVAWYFYLSVYVSIVSAFVFQAFVLVYKKEKEKKHKNEIIDEFININNLLLAELQTGIAVSLAYENLSKNIEDSEILDFPRLEGEIKSWINRLNVGEDISDILLDFANRSGEGSLVQFANMLGIASKRGGNILSIIMSTNSVLNDERQMKHDVEVLVTEKKLEQRVLTAMPIFMLMFLNYSAFDFIAPLYENLVGRITMTALLVIFTISYFWSRRITEIGNG